MPAAAPTPIAPAVFRKSLRETAAIPISFRLRAVMCGPVVGSWSRPVSGALNTDPAVSVRHPVREQASCPAPGERFRMITADCGEPKSKGLPMC